VPRAGEWRNPALTPARVLIGAGCYAGAACAGVVAWQVGGDSEELLAAPAASASPALAFTLTAAAALRVTRLGGTAPLGATVKVWGRAGNTFTDAGAPLSSVSAGVWAELFNGPWPGGDVPFTPPLVLAAGGNASLLVSVSGAGNKLSCAHALGNASATLLEDDALTIGQGGALTGAFAAGALSGAACAWDGLTLAYTTTAACAPPAPAPMPDIVTSAPHTLVGSLDDLLRALANENVTQIEIRDHITLNGAELSIALPPAPAMRKLRILGTNACVTANAKTPLCRLDAGGLTRIISVPERATLLLGHLLLRNGVAPPGQDGGCVRAACARCALTLDAVTMRNCSASSGAGGAAAATGGGTLVVTASLLEHNVALAGGGLVFAGGNVTLDGSTFADNFALGSSRAAIGALGGALGPAGGGAALHAVTTGVVTRCAFSGNAAATTDFVLLPHPGTPQARGGGLFVDDAANATVASSTFSANAAAFGAGAYAANSTLSLAGCALTDNIAPTGGGGGLFVLDCAGGVRLADSLVSGNSAGGYAGGGVGAVNTALDVARCMLSNNAAPAGCGGAAGLEAGATLRMSGTSVVHGNSASSGGGLCCSLCTAVVVEDALVYENVATQGSGGGLYASNTPTTVVNASFWLNTAPAGGALAALSSPLSLSDCELRSNAATDTHGGAVLHDAREDGGQALTLLRTLLDGNSCAAGGGAVAAFSSSSALLEACAFSNNTAVSAAPSGGSLVALNVPSLTVRNCSFTEDIIRLVPDLADDAELGYVNRVAALGAGHGGALWIGSKNASAALVEDSIFTHCAAPSGGAIYATGATALTVTGSNFYHDHSTDFSGVGGGLLTDARATAAVNRSLFFSCEAVRGGACWHGGSSRVVYTDCRFEGNEGVEGDDEKGSALYVGEDASASVLGSTFLDNVAHGIGEGTIVLGGSNASRLAVADSLFDGNTAHLGGVFFITVYSQCDQFSTSNLTFRNNLAYVGGILFSEAVDFEALKCSPTPCDTSLNNGATGYGDIQATPPLQFVLDMPTAIRSGAPLPINVTLQDGFNTTVQDWIDTTATINSSALLSGSLRTFYANGVAAFRGLTLKGDEGVSYDLEFTVAGPDLYGNDVNARTLVQAVRVVPCEQGETFDAVRLECQCADGFGLVLADNSCRACTDNGARACTRARAHACKHATHRARAPTLTCEPLFRAQRSSRPEAPRVRSAPRSAGRRRCTISASASLATLARSLAPRAFAHRCAGCAARMCASCAPHVDAPSVTPLLLQCPADTYRSDADDAAVCVDCPATSHTFALGATSAADCLCAADHFNDRGGGNDSFSCAAVPRGGWAPQADSRLFALKNFWRPGPLYTSFFPCSSGMCLREEPVENSTQLGYKCREGHTGHLCAVCADSWAYQGVFCEQCHAIDKYDNWPAAKKGGLIFIGLAMLCTVIFMLFFLPLFPGVEAAISSAVAPTMQRMERALGSVAAAVRPQSSSASRPGSARQLPAAIAGLAALTRQLRRIDTVALRRADSMAPSSMGGAGGGGGFGGRRSTESHGLTRRSGGSSFRRSSVRMGVALAADFGQGRTSSVHVRLERPSRVRVFVDMASEPLRVSRLRAHFVRCVCVCATCCA
jgi:hypothetical protein